MTPPGQARTCRIAVLGDGPVARATLHALLERGVGDTHDIELVPPAVGVPPLLATTASSHRRPTADPIRRLCLLCADVVDAQQVMEINARCLRDRTELIPGLVMGRVGQVGPAVVAGRNACLHCVDLRLRATTGRSCLLPYGPPDPLVGALVGREVARRALAFIADEAPDPGLSYHWPDGSVTRHSILRTLHCPSCGGLGRQPSFLRAGSPQPEAGPSGARGILDVEAELVDPVTGPIRSLERFQPEAHDPPLRHWVATLAEPGWAQAGIPALPCGGNSLDDDAARAAALGEAVERMCACQPAAADLIVASYDDVLADAVNPRVWDLFDAPTRSRPDFPYPEVTANDELSWVWGWSLQQGRPVLLPASRVFVPFSPRTAADNADHPTLSGFAAGTSVVSATLTALLEVIERDAFMIAWTNRLPLPRLRLDRESPDGVGGYIAAFEDHGVEVRCFLLMLDLQVPTVLAMARGARPGDPAVVLAAAADLDIARACRHALAELAANRLYVRHAMSLPQPPAGSADARAGSGNGRIYADPAMAAHLDFWWDSQATVPLQTLGRPIPPEVGLRRVGEALSAARLETVAVDLTPPELRRLGVVVVKALVPGTYQLTYDNRWPHLGGYRLRMAPVTAGFLDAPQPAASLNGLPHPFP